MIRMLMVAFCLIASPALSQETSTRYRVGLGLQLVPNFSGARDHNLRPLVDVSRARGDELFKFEAVDESFDIALLNTTDISAGPAVNLEGKRRRRDVGADIDEVGFTVEAGGYLQAWLADSLRARIEVRQGVNGHKGAIANLGIDYVRRAGDDWLFAIGPRLTISDRRYQDAYFGVSTRVAAANGLPVYRPDGGVHAVGATAGGNYQFSRRWGVMGYVKYDRLSGNAAASPFVRRFGSRDQISGGVALTYSFGKGFR